MYQGIEDVPAEELEFHSKWGYYDFKVVDGHLCCLYRFAYTIGLIVGITKGGYSYRYCFGTLAEAKGAYNVFDALMNEPEDFIVRKGPLWAEQYSPGDEYNRGVPLSELPRELQPV